MKKCSITGCEKHAAVRDLCGMHYARLKRHGTTDAQAKFFGTPEQRFWTKVEKSSGCWVWKASKHRDGYGLFNAGPAGYVMAHRFCSSCTTAQFQTACAFAITAITRHA